MNILLKLVMINDKPIWVAEDSILLSKMIGDSLRKANYVNLRIFPDGRELWEALNELPEEFSPPFKVLSPACVRKL